jgi:hypothetical protein
MSPSSPAGVADTLGPHTVDGSTGGDAVLPGIALLTLLEGEIGGCCRTRKVLIP